MAGISSLEKLDFILITLSESSRVSGMLYPENTWHDIMKEVNKKYENGFSSEDVRLALDKLLEDGYINEDTKEQENLLTGEMSIHHLDYEITFKGKIFIEKGGYRAEDAAENANSTAISELRIRQDQMANRLFWINLTIAFGTSIAGVYYLIEILKNFFYCH